MERHPMVADGDLPIASHLDKPGTHCTYLYDFGEEWSQKALLGAIVPREPKLKYPRCLAGVRACPPEDCGSTHGYARLCGILKDLNRTDEDAEELLNWLDDDFDPEVFDADKVQFGSVVRRLKELRNER